MISTRLACSALLAAAILGSQMGCGDSGGDESTSRGQTNSPGKTAAGGQAPAGDHAESIRGGEVQGHPQPPAPAVNAVRKADSVIVHFSFPEEEEGEEEPWLLLTSVDSAGTQVPPLTIRTPVAGRQSGAIEQPVGAGSPPFVLRVATLSRTGLRSPIVEFPLTK